jgi:hypothetical protein
MAAESAEARCADNGGTKASQVMTNTLFRICSSATSRRLSLHA